MNATTSNLRMRIEGECYFHTPPGALLKVISFALYKHVCITFQPTLVISQIQVHTLAIQETEKYDGNVFSNGIMFISNFVNHTKSCKKSIGSNFKGGHRDITVSS
jgi:hypothetical protein